MLSLQLLTIYLDANLISEASDTAISFYLEFMNSPASEFAVCVYVSIISLSSSRKSSNGKAIVIEQ